jgi:hypothetical protein
MVKAIGAAPLDQVPEGVKVDWIVAVCKPHHANFLAGCRVIQDGITPYGGFGTSLCGEIFSTPWYERNVVVTFGDMGGRMFNRFKQDELVVVIPTEYVDNIQKLLVDVQIDTKANLAFTKPPNSKFWEKLDKGETKDKEPEEAEHPSVPTFTMEWDEEAKEILKKVPEGIVDFVVENAESFAQKKGYDCVSRKSLDEQMKEMGMDLDEML